MGRTDSTARKVGELAVAILEDQQAIADTGVPGLDEILGGGLLQNRLYLLEGDPGAGKTTLALQFLLAGIRRGESCMFVALSETEDELRATAASHGWSMDGIEILCISPTDSSLKSDSRYTMYHPSEVELTETTRAVLAEAERINPARLVFDSLAELRLLAENQLRYRRQVLALKQFFARQQTTVIFIIDRTGDNAEMELQSIAHGVIALERTTSEYGAMRRRLQVIKQRGRNFQGGYHDLQIVRGGVRIFPRLVAPEHGKSYPRGAMASGVAALDVLLGGGLTNGTSTLVLGASGTGKSALASRYAVAAAQRGENAAMYLFDESLPTFLQRSEGLGMDIRPLVDAGRIKPGQVDPAALSPGEFAHTVRRSLEENDVRLVVIDSLNGYLNAMPDERFLTLHLHELLNYLGNKGVTTLLLMAQHGLLGDNLHGPVDASYLADTVLLLRYFEARGEVRRAISVIKKRTGRHERTIRELSFDGGVNVGEPLREFQGVLGGAPQFTGSDFPRSRT
jgi:circadian clock protein KaiC